MKEKSDFKFDVFLSYNTKDKPIVTELAQSLRGDGLRVWFDEWVIMPGDMITRTIDCGLEQSRIILLCMSKNSLGADWAGMETGTFRFRDPANLQRRFIPLRLDNSDIPAPLAQFAYVDWRTKSSDEYKKLLRTIKDSPALHATPLRTDEAIASESFTGVRLQFILNCRDDMTDTLHLRPAAFLVQFCKQFPKTEFRIFKTGVAEPIDPKNQMQLVFIGRFEHEDLVTLEVSGQLEIVAAACFKVICENLAGYSDPPVINNPVKAKLIKMIDETFARVYDPGLEDLEGAIHFIPRKDRPAGAEEYRSVTVINDRLHDISLLAIPQIAKHFGCNLQISFELQEKGIFSFSMTNENNHTLDSGILEYEIPVGTRFTVVSSGGKAKSAGGAVSNVLQSLWQCDEWLRRRVKGAEAIVVVPELIEFAKEMAKHSSNIYDYVQNPLTSNLLTTRQVFLNEAGKAVLKEDALKQLVMPHAVLYDLQASKVLERIHETEKKQIVLLRPGFALAHAAMDYGPRISLTFGVYPDGVEWSDDGARVNLVAMVVYTFGTIRTWRDYMKRFAILFRSHPHLVKQLIAAETSKDFIALLKQAEVSSVKDE
jgi:mannitol/fructose-specific phosphotransferase system IIA component (Ntr-type)/phosphotransferase system HPr-like phosphotransfer protein